MRFFVRLITTLLLCMLASALSCGGGGSGADPLGGEPPVGNQFYVGQIQGVSSIVERGTANYSIMASGVSGIGYHWYCVPDSPGSFSPSDRSTAAFRSWSVDSNTAITIYVRVSAPGYDDVTRSKTVTITNSGL